MGGLAEDRSCL